MLSEKRWVKLLLVPIRWLAVSSIAWLLLGPIWQGLLTKTEKPIIIFLEDISESIAAFSSDETLEAYEQQKVAMLDELADDYEVEQYRFGSELLTAEDNIPGSEKATDLSGSLKAVIERHSYQDVGAIIVATDGIYNRGFDPSYTGFGASTSVYTVALGDTSPYRDLFVESLLYPRVVYLGDQYQMDVEWGAYNVQGAAASVVVTDENGIERLRSSIDIDAVETFGRQSVILDADQPGIQKVSVRVQTTAEEDITVNNYRSAYIEVLDGRKNVLILYDYPHPDVKAFKQIIEANKNYEVEVAAATDFSTSLDDYDLIVLHGLPSIASSVGESIIDQCLSRQKSMLFVLTPSSDLKVFNEKLDVLQVTQIGGQSNEVQALLNKDFNDFQIPEGLEDAFRSYPPLLTTFGEFEAGSNARVIAWQRLGDINTGYPMIVSGIQDESRVMVVAGEGIWRWRMNEFARKEHTDVMDAFVNQLIQYVTVKEDKRRFRLFVDKNLILENEPVKFSAELYNANFELVNEPDVSLELVDADGTDYTYTMDKTFNGYTLDAGILPIGSYRAVARTSHAGEQHQASAAFTIREMQLETMNKQADHKLLFNLSASTGGKFYDAGNMAGLADAVKENVNLKPVLYTTEKNTSILHFQWIFFILLGLLTVEWFVRKWMGGF